MTVFAPRLNVHAYVDFDGTIMPCDTTDFLLERFALPEWRDVEAEWAAGKIGSAVCMARQIDLLRVTADDLEGAVSELEIDPGFADFVSDCRANSIGISIVSDGLDWVIAATLRRCGLDVPYFANHLVPVGTDRWKLEFPFGRSDCQVAAGHCKCSRSSDRLDDHLKVVVGDGRSDFCIAGRADLVLAKSSLLKHCELNDLACVAFNDFHDVRKELSRWLSSQPQRRQGGERQLVGA